MTEKTELDLRSRSNIILETSNFEKMNQEELIQKRKEIIEKFNKIVNENNYDFMLDEPKIKGYKKAEEILKNKILKIFR